jgi:hypothetical protein
MTIGTLGRALGALILLYSGAALAAEGPVSLVKQPKIGAAEAFPRLADPKDEAAKRINAALDRQDRQLGKAAAACRKDGGKTASWDRSVTTAMTGPGYLTLIAADETDCGGAYPDTGQLVLVYDLQTGSPVNWTRLLPAALAGTVALDNAADGSKIGTVNSPKLHALYTDAYPQRSDRADCLDSIADLPFILWPDAKSDGLVLAPSGLPHVVSACGESVTIPTATLKTLGVDARLTEAIDAAHHVH